MADHLHIRWTPLTETWHVRWTGVVNQLHPRWTGDDAWDVPTQRRLATTAPALTVQASMQHAARPEVARPAPRAEVATEPKPVLPTNAETLHERWVAPTSTATTAVEGEESPAPAKEFHFNFDAVRAHHTMPYPAIEWLHGKPIIIFNLAAYTGKNVQELQQHPGFATADVAPYLSWATTKAAGYGTSPETFAKAMSVASSKAYLTFPQALSWVNNQTFVGTLALLVLAVVLFVKRPKAGQVKPQGVVQHMLESVVLFVRNDIVRPNIKGPVAHHHAAHDDLHGGHAAGTHSGAAAAVVAGFRYADSWVPHFAALFLCILAFNLAGLIPGGGVASGNPGVTVAFAVTTLLAMLFFGFKEQGIVRFWINLVPVHWSFKPMDMLVWCLLFVIELLGLLIKPAALAIRLAANMFAGHTAVLAFTTLGFIIFAGDQSQGAMSLGLGAVGWVVAVALYFLELLVAFIQAYIFTLLSAIFIGTSIHPEH